MDISGLTYALKFYGHGLIQLLIEPKCFFSTLPGAHTPARALGFLGLTSLFFAGAGLLTGVGGGSRALMALIYFTNAAGMVALGAVLGFCAMVMMFGRKQGFSLVFGLYTYACGITLLVSWLPFLLWFTEPWKYWLVYLGFKHTCGLSGKKAVAVLAVSLPVQWILILSALGATA